MSALTENIAARQRAEAMIELCGNETPRFWEEVIRMASANLPAKPAPVDPNGPMSEEEALRFGRKTFPRGKNEGRRVDETDNAYCLWWAEEDQFSIQLRRYVKSDLFQRHQIEPHESEDEE